MELLTTVSGSRVHQTRKSKNLRVCLNYPLDRESCTISIFAGGMASENVSHHQNIITLQQLACVVSILSAQLTRELVAQIREYLRTSMLPIMLPRTTPPKGLEITEGSRIY